MPNEVPECPICYLPIEAHGCVLQCKHEFHLSCLHQAFMHSGKHKQCPYCRFPCKVPPPELKEMYALGASVTFFRKVKRRDVKMKGTIVKTMANSVDVVTDTNQVCRVVLEKVFPCEKF